MQTIKSLCEPYHLDTHMLKDAYLRKRPMQMDQVYAAAQLLEACAGYLWLQRYISLRENSLMHNLDEYLSANLHTDLSVYALCHQFDVSRSKLYKLVKEFYGKGNEQVVREMRMEHAKELLASTDYSVSEVAARVGFDDYNYFIKVFREAAGITPARYRKAKIRFH